MSNTNKKNFLKSWGLLFIALAMAGGAFWLSTNYLTNKEGLLRDEILSQREQKIDVVVAAGDLKAGTVVNLESMALASVTANNISAFAIRPQDFKHVQGKIIRFPMSPGEPLLSHFMAGDSIERFSDLLESNERAVTLEIDRINSAAGMLVAGDFVDVMLLMDEEDDSSQDNKNLRPLLQNVRVLSVDAYPLHSKKQDFVIATDRDGLIHYGNITVGVPFDDAAKLVLARDIGDIVFLLRNKEDHQFHDGEMITKLDLDQEKKQGNSYQFYAATAGGVIKPMVKLIASSPDINRNKRVFSQPIVKELDSANSDDQNSSIEE